MKKMLALGIVVLAISLGFTACGEKGGTVKVKNGTDDAHYFEFYFGSTSIRVNDGQTQLQPRDTVQAVSDEDTSYVVYIDGAVKWTGDLSGGETKEHTIEK